ncbi:MAG TPA: Ig-like domain-containing protein, partial [Candidatus Methylomirabilis sp.]|nr:Ig-like domain-containing protein [Candidatus Methylomirabilis sp.]
MQPFIEHQKKELVAGGAGAAILILLFFIVCYTARPVLTDPPTSTKDPKVTLSGKAAPRMGVILFDGKGNSLFTVNANDKGEFTFPDVPVGEGSTVFVLRAANAGFRFSFPTKVTVVKDTSAPRLEVNAFDGATVTGSNTVISGKAEPGSSVMVNGVKTAVGADGAWSATVALKSGANTVTVTSTDAAGNTTTATQTIQYTPTAADSPTGTATVSTSTTTYTPGSLPPPSATSTSSVAPSGGTATTTAPTAEAPSPAPAPAPSPTGTSPAPV